MALFFDSAWFDARLSASGLTRATLATALGLETEELGEVWKDQRELEPGQVRIMAVLLGADAKEIASRAGISTPVPRDGGAREDEPRAGGIEERLARLEADVCEIRQLLKLR